MTYSRPGENITAGIENYLFQKEKQYSQELSEVRSHLEERVKEVKTDLRKLGQISKETSSELRITLETT